MSDEKKDHGCSVGGDVIQAIAPPTPDGRVKCIRHMKDHEIQFGYLSPLKDGRPIAGQLVHATPREDGLLQVHHDDEAEHGSGPANVNSKAYLDGWDRIFGNRAPTGQA